MAKYRRERGIHLLRKLARGGGILHNYGSLGGCSYYLVLADMKSIKSLPKHPIEGHAISLVENPLNNLQEQVLLQMRIESYLYAKVGVVF